MPKSSFILLAKSSAMDKETGSLSIFDVVEKIQVAKIPPPKEGEIAYVAWQPMRLISEWIIESQSDYEQEFDFHVLGFLPGATEPQDLGKGIFKFETGKQRQRFQVIFGTPIPLEDKAGVLRFESKIKPVGTEEWKSQEYVVFVEVLEQLPPLPPMKKQ